MATSNRVEQASGGGVPAPGSAAAPRALLVAAGLAALLLGIAYARTFATLWRMWMHNPNYSHGFLVPPIALGLLWIMRRKLAAIPAAPAWGGLPLLLAGVGLHVVGIRGDVTMFQANSLVLVLAGLVWTWFGWPMLRQAWFPILFLTFGNPTFPALVNLVSFRLKAIAAFSSVELARSLGVAVTRQGMDLHFPTGTMTIEGACSGLNSLIALMAMGALFAHLGTGPAWRRWLLFLLSVPVALGANIVRITSLAVFAALTDTTRATGLFHDIGGFVLYSVALLSLVILKRILRC